MVENTTNEGMTNNSNQPSTIEKLEQIINTRISDLNSELDELRSIKVTDEIKKLVVGSTEFNIEDFMSEPDIDRFRNWLKIKKELSFHFQYVKKTNSFSDGLIHD